MRPIPSPMWWHLGDLRAASRTLSKYNTRVVNSELILRDILEEYCATVYLGPNASEKQLD